MMTRDDVIALLNTIYDDASVWVDDNGNIDVTIEDFEGFDENWDEIMRDYDEGAVESVYEALASAAVSVTDDFYTVFNMGDFSITWGYASYDI